MECLKRNLIRRQCGGDPIVNGYLDACTLPLPALGVITIRHRDEEWVVPEGA